MELFEQTNSTNVKRFCITQGVPRSSFQRWLTRKDLYMQTTRGVKHRSHGGQGLTESITFSRGLVTFMKVVRQNEHVLTAAQILNWMKKHHPHLLDVYSASKKNDVNGYNSLMRLCQQYAPDMDLTSALHLCPSCVKNSCKKFKRRLPKCFGTTAAPTTTTKFSTSTKRAFITTCRRGLHGL
ncbi:hypothetical protein AaE_012301 [Aphanomyces astaci]|uniref:Uncharacterized protein n=1 Tax=Aphanomyces astaci TaxID=112090 RepID=A0A6A4ZHL2_APHAT|nr:hypothetical protein AaE_012301 [Aphanomyces astaci]